MSNHSQEFSDFESFKGLLPDAAGNFTHGGNDFPDFADTTRGLAVEHTRAFLGPQSNRGSEAKAIEAHQRKVCIHIEGKLKLGNFPPYEVRIWFVGDPKDPSKLADQLLTPLQTQLTANAHVRLSRADDASTSLPSGIWEAEFIPGGERHDVFPTEGARLVQGPVDAIQRAIGPKNERLKRFLGAQIGGASFNRFWLLVVADPWNMELPDITKQHVFNSEFDETFFLERTPERITTLKTSKQSASAAKV
jgi:hypothetical protein